ncbi:DUF2975 domain-containing protein [Chryseomicrobium sp. FSL W7-1435]|uniref:DUF2975 domain-containing protein n=1 Tax=Chryseomicrobium sp. FSL W7-1435 TaxID=2921704 RepID=UPI003159D977
MKKGTTFFLKIALLVIALPVAVICFYAMPLLAIEAFSYMNDENTLPFIMLGLVAAALLSAIPYYSALFQAYKLLRLIETNAAFSDASVRALKKIKRSGLWISFLFTLALPLIFMVAQWDDAPGLVLIGMVIVGASVVVAVFAAVLEALLQEAITYKLENELTI